MKKILIIICVLFMSYSIKAQIRPVSTESFEYKEVEGRIVINLTINGTQGDFLLDLKGKNLVTNEFSSKLNLSKEDISTPTVFDTFEYRNIEFSKKVLIKNLAFGNNVFSNGVSALIAEGTTAKYLQSLGVDGIINSSIFNNSVLTIDKSGKRIFTSVPYIPPFMRLTERIECSMSKRIPEFDIIVDGKKTKVNLDTWQKETLIWDSNENLLKKNLKKVNTKISSIDYSPNILSTEQVLFSDIALVNVHIKNYSAAINSKLSAPSLGLGILDYGLLSIDFDKDKVYFQSYESTKIGEIQKPTLSTIVAGKLNDINKYDFQEYIYNYVKDANFNLKGDKPVIIDFWAPWCGPCMRMMPTMEKLAAKYKDQIIFYKVNADLEKELSAKFNVQALPTMFYILPGEKPRIEIGDQADKVEQIIEQYLLKDK